MGASKARRMAIDAAQSAAERAGTKKGDVAAYLAIAYALLEVAHQVRRLGEQFPVYGPPEERT